MVTLQSSPFRPAFDEFVNRVEARGLISSPFISIGPVQRLVKVTVDRGLQDSLRLDVLTDISLRNLVQGSTDISSLVFLCEHLPGTVVRFLPHIHAKVYVADTSYALVTSANFTDGGATKNFEYGVSVEQPDLVRKITDDVEAYAALGGEVTLGRLRELEVHVRKLRDLVSDEQRTINLKLRAATAEIERQAEEQLLRARVQGRSINAVFSDTILYLLRQRAMTTVELNLCAQQIHPDLCDDLLDRVIDGQAFGKLWKHQLRTAQQHLKKAGLITNDPATGIWMTTPDS
jgi:hypothetical protein